MCETEKPNVEGCAENRRVRSHVFPVPEGPERTIVGGVDAVGVCVSPTLRRRREKGGGGGEGYLEEPFCGRKKRELAKCRRRRTSEGYM